MLTRIFGGNTANPGITRIGNDTPTPLQQPTAQQETITNVAASVLKQKPSLQVSSPTNGRINGDARGTLASQPWETIRSGNNLTDQGKQELQKYNNLFGDEGGLIAFWFVMNYGSVAYEQILNSVTRETKPELESKLEHNEISGEEAKIQFYSTFINELIERENQTQAYASKDQPIVRQFIQNFGLVQHGKIVGQVCREKCLKWHKTAPKEFTPEQSRQTLSEIAQKLREKLQSKATQNAQQPKQKQKTPVSQGPSSSSQSNIENAARPVSRQSTSFGDLGDLKDPVSRVNSRLYSDNSEIAQQKAKDEAATTDKVNTLFHQRGQDINNSMSPKNDADSDQEYDQLKAEQEAKEQVKPTDQTTKKLKQNQQRTEPTSDNEDDDAGAANLRNPLSFQPKQSHQTQPTSDPQSPPSSSNKHSPSNWRPPSPRTAPPSSVLNMIDKADLGATDSQNNQLPSQNENTIQHHRSGPVSSGQFDSLMSHFTGSSIDSNSNSSVLTPTAKKENQQSLPSAHLPLVLDSMEIESDDDQEQPPEPPPYFIDNYHLVENHFSIPTTQSQAGSSQQRTPPPAASTTNQTTQTPANNNSAISGQAQPTASQRSSLSSQQSASSLSPSPPPSPKQQLQPPPSTANNSSSSQVNSQTPPAPSAASATSSQTTAPGSRLESRVINLTQPNGRSTPIPRCRVEINFPGNTTKEDMDAYFTAFQNQILQKMAENPRVPFTQPFYVRFDPDAVCAFQPIPTNGSQETILWKHQFNKTREDNTLQAMGKIIKNPVDVTPLWNIVKQSITPRTPVSNSSSQNITGQKTNLERTPNQTQQALIKKERKKRQQEKAAVRRARDEEIRERVIKQQAQGQKKTARTAQTQKLQARGQEDSDNFLNPNDGSDE
jgi:hypothetical protein